jgi:P-type E1-E2 ATPase
LPGVPERLAQVAERLRVVLVSADTFGTLARTAKELGVEARTAPDGAAKVAVLDELGRDGCAAIGNGANDAAALKAAALGVAVLGPEGASAEALAAADAVCLSILDALDLVVDERALVATLRR